MAKKKVAKKAVLSVEESHRPTSEACVSLQIDLHVMGVKLRRRLEEAITEHLKNVSGQVIGQRSYSRGSLGRGITFDVSFSNRMEASTAATMIYSLAVERDNGDGCYSLAFYVDGQRLEMEDDKHNSAGSKEMIIALVNKSFDKYCQLGGELERRAFLQGCLGSGGVERIYVEEGLTPSWQQLGAWYYE
jgi:hypothetical protein